jgi:hypothetical protein
VRAWSSSERVAHRARPPAPSAARGLGREALLGGDAFEMRDQRPGSTRRRSKRWQRDSNVTGTLRISVVANTNLAWRRFERSSSALNAW